MDLLTVRFHYPVYGLYQFRVMPFGISEIDAMCSSRAIQLLSINAFAVYLNDVIIFSKSLDDHTVSSCVYWIDIVGVSSMAMAANLFPPWQLLFWIGTNICDRILENHSKLLIRSFEINSFKAIITCQGKQACIWNLHKRCINLSPFRPKALLAAFKIFHQ